MYTSVLGIMVSMNEGLRSYFDPDLDYEETVFFTILESTLSVEEKAEKLF